MDGFAAEPKISDEMLQLLVKHRPVPPSKEVHTPQRSPIYQPPINFLPVFIALLLLAVAWRLLAGYRKDALKVEDIETSLTPEELQEYRAHQHQVEKKFEQCTQYILYALDNGLYQCRSCPPGIPFVTLKKGEIWYIGHTCRENDARHSRAFRQEHNVWMFTNFVGTKEECHKIELKLLQGYRYLPESQKQEIKLILPPNNRTAQN